MDGNIVGEIAYWSDRAPTLFPFIGRDSYQYQGTVYTMDTVFAAGQDFACQVQEKNRLVLELVDNEQTRKQYPFAFSWRLDSSWWAVRCRFPTG